MKHSMVLWTLPNDYTKEAGRHDVTTARSQILPLPFPAATAGEQDMVPLRA